MKATRPRKKRRTSRWAVLCTWGAANKARALVYGVGGALALGWLVDVTLLLPSEAELAALARTRPVSTALMERRREQAADEGKTLRIRQTWVPLASIAEVLQRAVVITEDASFYVHEGVDWHELRLAIRDAVEEGDELRGASTITQQLAKNLYLSPVRSPVRKLEEMVIARRMERVLGKARILELYLNLIEWGPGLFGVEQAARTYFGKGAADLTREEAARLAAVIASPLRHPASGDSRFVTRRARLVLERLEAAGW